MSETDDRFKQLPAADQAAAAEVAVWARTNMPVEGEVLAGPGPRDPGGRDEQILLAWVDGDNVGELAARWNVSPDRVEEILRRQIRASAVEVAGQPAAPARQTWQERAAAVSPKPTWQERAAAAVAEAHPDSRRDPRVLKFLDNVRSESTRRKYRWAIDLYLDFCDLNDRVEVPGDVFTLEAFAAWMAERSVSQGKNKGAVGLSPNTIRLAVSAVRTFHRIHGLNPPDAHLAREVITSHERTRADDPEHKFRDGQGVPPVKLPMLRDLVATCDQDTLMGVRDRAILCGGLAMMARRRVLANLDIEDLRDEDRGIEVFVRKDKTDQTGKGRTIKLVPWPAMPDLDPVTALKAWRAKLAELGIVDGPLFRAVDKHGRVNGHPLWIGKRGLSVRMDPIIVEVVVQRCAQRAMVANWQEYAGHSLRAGGATVAYEAGADILSIARHGGWGDRSPVVFRYIRDVDDWLRNPMLLVGAGAQRTNGTT